MRPKHYAIRGGVEGLQRLKLLARVLQPTTLELFRRVGVGPGMVCLDVGCGGGDVSFDLARRVGPAGRVVGTDLDPAKLERARREADEEKLGNVEFREADVSEGFDALAYDLVYARFLLTHLSRPEAALAHMVQALRPQGAVVVEDIDFTGHFSYPECAAFARYVELYTAVVRRRGGDPNIGPRLPSLLSAAGLADVGMQVVQPAAFDGEVKLLNAVTLENIAPALMSDGLASEDEIAKLVSELYAFARDTRTVMSIARIVQAWGYRR
jgi:SAM-dependent methyltransferase